MKEAIVEHAGDVTIASKQPDPADAKRSPEELAAERIMADLVNALLAEGLWEAEARGDVLDALPADAAALNVFATSPAAKGALFFRWWRDREAGSCLIFPIRPAVIQPYRYVSGGGVYELSGSLPDNRSDDESSSSGMKGLSEQGLQSYPKLLDPLSVLEQVTGALYPAVDKAAAHDGAKQRGAERLLALLRLSLEQARWSLRTSQAPSPEAEAPSPSSLDLSRLIALERLAALRDRPYHPVAKAKGGWSEADYEAYSAESGMPFQLRWIAVKRSELLMSGNVRARNARLPSEPAELLLSPPERQQLEAALQRSGLSAEAYMALPVHPWQLAAVLPKVLQHELQTGICVPLETAAGTYCATSSARSLAPADGGAVHVKLPLGIVSLGAVRYLPAVHMINGERGQALLEQARRLDPVLEARLYLCDERSWWAYLPEDGDYFAEPPRHASVLIRKYPEELVRGEGISLVPMSSLAVPDTKVMNEWLQLKGLSASKGDAKALFKDICCYFLHLCLRLFRLGVMPEIHGQNVLLVVRHGEITGLLLRDHDSVRLYLPWMNLHGLSDPCYKMKPGYPNSLYNETPGKLLYYVQTLGIQVNLYAILEATAERFGIDERELWMELREALLQAAELAELREDIHLLVKELMLDSPVWPWKNLLKPLLEQEGLPTGSMPSGSGKSVNPFHRLS